MVPLNDANLRDPVIMIIKDSYMDASLTFYVRSLNEPPKQFIIGKSVRIQC